ncbi:MAG TPA: alkene reductase [Mucilaginibacter sp.]|jgi:N-ethylmaleimide reductase|nr:alkene reductase [Mucilaginibacter sp.]
MATLKIFSPTIVGAIEVKNRVVMSPMTRCRALGNVPNELMVKYYEQRAGAGLIVTEGTSPSPNGLGYARIPGIFSQAQVEGWKKVTEAVHAKGGKIVIQFMHSGRIGHPANLPGGAKLVGPSAIKAAGQMWTDTLQMQDMGTPEALSTEEVQSTKQEFITAAKNAMEAGFDGVELHGANGYLLEQFLSPFSNVREDEYGGSIQNRCRFVLEVAADVAEAIGADRTGIRLSPYGVASDMPHYPEINATYTYLAEELGKIGIAYVHVVDHSALGAPAVPLSIKQTIRQKFKNTVILAGGYTLDRAEADLQSGLGDMIAFGRPFINNPDLVDRLETGHPLSQDLKMDMFYSAAEAGYVDYPVYAE